MGAHEVEAVVEALRRAGPRLFCVDETGHEHDGQEAVDAAIDAGLNAPNYCSPPKVTDGGVQMYVDCKGAIDDPMAFKFREILQHELGHAGVDARVEVVTSDE